MRHLFKVLIALSFASPCHAEFLNVAGQWRSPAIDENQNKPCDATFTIVQTDVAFSISDRTWVCDGGAYSIAQPGLSADLVPYDAATLKIVSNGQVIGIILRDKIQLNINTDTGEAMQIYPYSMAGRFQIRESIIHNGVGHAMKGLMVPAVDSLEQ